MILITPSIVVGRENQYYCSSLEVGPARNNPDDAVHFVALHPVRGRLRHRNQSKQDPYTLWPQVGIALLPTMVELKP